MESAKHACMLPQPPFCTDLPPTARGWRRCLRRMRHALLPCAWHHGSVVFIRSRKCLELEREKQLKSGHWFVWHPYSPIKFYWDCAVMVSNLCANWYMPWQVFYYCPNPADPLILATDFIAFCDILVLFISGYNDEDNKKFILEPKKIALHYLKGTFVIDLIAALPLQLYQPFDNCMYPSHTIFFPIKLLRMFQTSDKIEAFIEQSKLPYSCTALLSVIVLLLYFFHWMTYVHYQVPTISAHFYDVKNSSSIEAEWLRRYKVDVNKSLFEKYVMNLYFVCGLCIGAGYYSPVKDHVRQEMILNSVMGIVGIVFLTYCFMTVLRLVLYSQYQKYTYDSRLKDLEKYMITKRLPKSLRQKIELFINYKFCGNYLNEALILNTINEQIKQDINMHSCKRLVASVPLFRDMPVPLTNAIIFSLKLEILVPGQKVLKCGEPSDKMFFISFGTVTVMDENDKELEHLNDGAYFGEAAMLRPGAPATRSLTALEITEIFVLFNADFQACIQPYPHLKRRFEENRRRRERRAMQKELLKEEEF